MNDEGIWVSKIVSTSFGDAIVSIRLDGAINSSEMLDKLDKEKDLLEKKMDKALQKLDRLNDKTPPKIMDAAMKELLDIIHQQDHNSNEWRKWFKVWEKELCGNTALSDLWDQVKRDHVKA